ncbi:hypothetical protein HK104_005463, partial [Borealophlyctis nickersoniae]
MSSPSPTSSPSRQTTASFASLAKSFKDKTAVAAKAAAKNTAEWHARASEKGGVLYKAKEMGQELGAKAAASAAAAKEAAKRSEMGEKVVTYLKKRDEADVRDDSTDLRAMAGLGVPANPVFGARLADAVDRSQVEGPGNPGYGIDIEDVPAVIYRSIEYLDVHGLEEVGLYRLSGSATEVSNLKILFNSGADLDLTTIQTDTHAVASMFKSYLRELPESILTKALAPKFIELSSGCATDPERGTPTPDPALLNQMATLCTQLPRENYSVLAMIAAHLYRVQERQAVNKMGLGNLQVIFSPTLGVSSSLLALFVMHHDRVLPLPVPSSVKRTQRGLSAVASVPAPSLASSPEKPARPKSIGATLNNGGNVAAIAAKYAPKPLSSSPSTSPPTTPPLRPSRETSKPTPDEVAFVVPNQPGKVATTATMRVNGGTGSPN